MTPESVDDDFLSFEYEPTGHPRKATFDFLNLILDKCDIDEFTGQFKCKKCKVILSLDWFDKEIDDCMCDED